MHHSPRDIGFIEVICGPMFSGKTEELIRRLKRAQIARQRVQAFKPQADRRYDHEQIVSHSRQRLVSTPVGGVDELLSRVEPATHVVGIDEVQFLGPSLVEACEELASRGLRVICAGLDQDYCGRPFDPMPALLALAEHITKLNAICVVCGQPANRSQRLVGISERVVVGGADAYEPRCRKCFQPAVDEAPFRQPELFNRVRRSVR